MILDCLNIRDEMIKDIEIKNKVYGKIDTGRAVFIQVGNRADSNSYIKSKKNLCDKYGYKYVHIQFEEKITEKELLKEIDRFNNDEECVGIMVQLPLPKHIKEETIINAIKPEKDIDGFTLINKGKLVVGDKTGIIPCTPLGISKLLEHVNFDCKGKKVVVVGRSNIVGKPMTQLLINKGATVISCNSATKPETLKELILNCDLVITAMDKPNFFDVEYFGRENLNKLNNIFAIDVGIFKDEQTGRLTGNISKELYNYFKYITPVPKGVGPLTVAGVLMNIEKCYQLQNKKGRRYENI